MSDAQRFQPIEATHRDPDGDYWRITPSCAELWSDHQRQWVEARSVLELMHRIPGQRLINLRSVS